MILRIDSSRRFRSIEKRWVEQILFFSYYLYTSSFLYLWRGVNVTIFCFRSCQLISPASLRARRSQILTPQLALFCLKRYERNEDLFLLLSPLTLLHFTVRYPWINLNIFVITCTQRSTSCTTSQRCRSKFNGCFLQLLFLPYSYWFFVCVFQIHPDRKDDIRAGMEELIAHASNAETTDDPASVHKSALRAYALEVRTRALSITSRGSKWLCGHWITLYSRPTMHTITNCSLLTQTSLKFLKNL